MKRIGLLSDTHGYLDKQILSHLEVCDEIWHAGDIGTITVLEQLENLKPLRAVYGNIDGHEIRAAVPETQRFIIENVDVLIKHIGGYPGRYDRSVFPVILNNPPQLFISGHSHILKVMPDHKFNLLHINPGAAGKMGLHKVRTLVRFSVDKKNITDLEVVELHQKNY
ncbi:MAG: metallophosphoesterase family protein [Bacteroidales bacterium]|nr:metallophosphoesterase family protein [Bacteroidales bacterium]